jgi:hypothetical protein
MSPIADMKSRCLETVEVYRRMGIRVGPSSKSGFWPEFQFDRSKDYAPDHTRIIRLPTAAEISRADEFTTWVNTHLSDNQRLMMWEWAKLKLSPKRTIRGFCEKIGLREHEYRRKIGKIFQHLAFSVTHDPDVMRLPCVDDGEKTGNKRAGSENYWRDDDGFTRRQMIRRLLEKSEQRTGSKIRAA